MDWTLDVIVSPDLKHHLRKDEDELEEAVRRGVYSKKRASQIRDAADRALDRLQARRPPFDEPWEHWRPPAGWTVPQLPERWE